MEPITWHTEKRMVKDLIPAGYNPRIITEKEKQDLMDSITTYGEVEPLVINTNNTLIGGHQRSTIYADLGIEEIEVRVPNRELTIEEEMRLNLRLNRNTGEWDDKKLKIFFNENMLEEVGWESREVDNIFRERQQYEDDFCGDDERALVQDSTTKHGDVFQLGDHRLMCGDSTSKDDVGKLMGGVSADMIFTDPPYNMNIDGKNGKIMNDHMSEESFIEFCVQFVARMREASKSGASFYICSGYQSYIPFMYALRVNQMNFSGPIIWVKNTLGLGANDYRHAHEMILKAKSTKKNAEPILYGWNEGKHYFIDARDEADVWEIGRRANGTMVHPTQKPIALVTKAITNSSKRGEVILDLFAGSGSTLVAAEKVGRRTYMMELDPKYCDVIIKRWENLTGQQAVKI